MSVLVLGTGIVGSAAISDLLRRGYTVVGADASEETAVATAERFGIEVGTFDVTDDAGLRDLLLPFDLVVSAVPYRFGSAVTRAAIATGTHCLDFGGNPTVVADQIALEADAIKADVLIVPDCGLAPGVANVMATQLIEDALAEHDGIDSVQIRVGALPQKPTGTLGYQLAFNSAGLINEYAEPCEVLEDGIHRTVEPLARTEDVAWEDWGPLEAFSTAGGTSRMCVDREGQVGSLEYKTLRFPGHGVIFRTFYDLGLFDELPDPDGQVPRDVLLGALDRNLPRGAPDLVLVRAWLERDGETHTLEFEDVEQDGFTALARTTAFPATALAHLILNGTVDVRGVKTMHQAVRGADLLPELESVNIHMSETRTATSQTATSG
jgi:lysine 6-dehydrogenase